MFSPNKNPLGKLSVLWAYPKWLVDKVEWFHLIWLKWNEIPDKLEPLNDDLHPRDEFKTEEPFHADHVSVNTHEYYSVNECVNWVLLTE